MTCSHHKDLEVIGVDTIHGEMQRSIANKEQHYQILYPSPLKLTHLTSFGLTSLEALLTGLLVG